LDDDATTPSISHELTKRCASDSVEKLATALSNAQVGLNPHQIEAALFAFRNHSLYEYVVYDSEIERAFARKLDQRQDIKLFVKLPSWFEIDTPVGKYNPDWAILKHDGQAMYLVRETKGTKDFLKLRTSEADKVRCGQRHFEAIGVPFSVVVTADEV
jgi:restriction endonuclease